jgi:hypothetical protein
MSRRERDAIILVEGAVTAFRERDPSGMILPSPSWADLDPAGRESVFEAQLLSRRLERLFDPGGLSTTARAVLLRLSSLL